MINYLGMVREFHEKYGHFTSKTICGKDSIELPHKIIVLRDNLIMEEVKEFVESVRADEIADAIADLLYVTFGAALAYGIPIEAVFAEVHRSNMTKPLAKDEYGKTLKGGYEPPRIKEILERKKPKPFPPNRILKQGEY